MNLMTPLRVHEGDDLPTLYFRLYDEEVGQWLDLSDSSAVVTAKFRAQGTDDVLNTVTCSKLFGGSTGLVSFTWPGTALDVDVGKYEIEVSISFGGDVQTVNNYYWEGYSNDWSEKLPVKILEDF